MTTYEELSQKPASQKIVLAWINALERLVLWTLDSGAIYKRTVGKNFVVKVSDGTTDLVSASSAALNQGEFFYDSAAGILYVRMTDDSNPQTKQIAAHYRFFFSNSPEILPYDLDAGVDVEYEGRLAISPRLKKELDDEQSGLALEGSSNIALLNKDGYFDDLFDTLIWEFKNVVVYSWSPSIPLSEKKKIFEGIIQNKSFSSDIVSFSLKDDLLKLRDDVQVETFSSSDGNVSDSILDTPKRRLYGQFQNLECIPIDNILDGFALTGTISGDLGASIITGIGTDFLNEVSPNDTITVKLAVDTVEISVESVDSPTQLTLSDLHETSFADETGFNSPEIPYRGKNRRHHIAGHKLREPVTTITEVVADNRLRVADTTDFFADDLIDISGTEDVQIKRIVNDVLVLKQNLQLVHIVTDNVTKNPVSRVFIGENESFINRDWTVENTATDSVLVFNDLAEFNVAKTRSILGTFDFTSGSEFIDVTGIDALNELKPRDWIRSKDITHTTWYEILSVSDDQIELRIAYAGANFNGAAQRKNVNYIDDLTLITVDCVGMEKSGTWIKTASDAVKDLVVNDAGLSNIDSSSFDQSKIEAPYVLSYAIPAEPGGSIPKIRDAISTINESVFGSLVNDNDFNIVYQILTPEKPEALDAVEDHDILSFSVNSKNTIIRKIRAQYRPFVDRFRKENTFKVYEFTNDFVDKFVGSKETREVTIYLFDDNPAETIAQRIALYNSLSQSSVTVRTKLNLMLKNLNDKIYLSLDRIYKRFGNRDRKKIGIINNIVKSGDETTVEFIDLGNVFNRVMSITPDAALDFTSATDDEKIKNGYILDDTLELPDVSDDKNIFTQIIG